MENLFKTYLEQVVKNPESFTDKQLVYIGKEYFDNPLKIKKWIEKEAYRLAYYTYEKSPEIKENINKDILWSLNNWGILEDGILEDSMLFNSSKSNRNNPYLITKEELQKIFFRTIELKSKNYTPETYELWGEE